MRRYRLLKTLMYDRFMVKQLHDLEYRVAFLTRNKAIGRFFTSMAINSDRLEVA
jgi:hypothetical protein